MGKHNIRPAEEEIGNLLSVFLFIIMWYSATGAVLTQNGFQTILILFLAAGLLPVYQAVNSIRRAFSTAASGRLPLLSAGQQTAESQKWCDSMFPMKMNLTGVASSTADITSFVSKLWIRLPEPPT